MMRCMTKGIYRWLVSVMINNWWLLKNKYYNYDALFFATCCFVTLSPGENGMRSCYGHCRETNCHLLTYQYPFWSFAHFAAIQSEDIQWHVDWLALVLLRMSYNSVNRVSRLDLSCKNGSWNPFWVKITLVSPWAKRPPWYNCTEVSDLCTFSPFLCSSLHCSWHAKVWCFFCSFFELPQEHTLRLHPKSDVCFDVK